MLHMPRPTSLQQDLFCILLLAVLSLTLWLPVLGAVSLNPDESQYEATASFLVTSGTSAFLPNGAPGMFGLFMPLCISPLRICFQVCPPS